MNLLSIKHVGCEKHKKLKDYKVEHKEWNLCLFCLLENKNYYEKSLKVNNQIESNLNLLLEIFYHNN